MNELEFFAGTKQKPKCLLCGCGFVWKGFNQDQCANPQCRNHSGKPYEHLLSVAWKNPIHLEALLKREVGPQDISLGSTNGPKGQVDLYYRANSDYDTGPIVSIVFYYTELEWENMEVDDGDSKLERFDCPFMDEPIEHSFNGRTSYLVEAKRRARLLRLKERITYD